MTNQNVFQGRQHMKKIRFFSVVAAFLLMAIGSAIAAEDQLAQDEQAGIEAFDRGDLVSAMTIFERAAAAGSALSQTRLAWILDGANEDERAVAMYRAAAEQEYAPGMHGLGEMYAKGEGVDKDLTQAVAWFTKAANAGHDKSLRLLIRAYEDGGLGQSADPDKARAYREKLAGLSDEADAGAEQ